MNSSDKIYSHLFDIQLFPSINYCNALFVNSNIEFEQYEYYQKTGFANRYEISSPLGRLKLSVPLLGGRDQKRVIKDLKISPGKWQQQHRRTLESCYGRSPFFEFYAPLLQPLFEKEYIFLLDLQLDGIRFLERVLKQRLGWKLSESFRKTEEGLVDLRHKFDKAAEMHFSYPQVFQEQTGFIKNLSVLDLLFNVGPESFNNLSRKP